MAGHTLYIFSTMDKHLLIVNTDVGLGQHSSRSKILISCDR